MNRIFKIIFLSVFVLAFIFLEFFHPKKEEYSFIESSLNNKNVIKLPLPFDVDYNNKYAIIYSVKMVIESIKNKKVVRVDLFGDEIEKNLTLLEWKREELNIQMILLQ